MSLSRRIAGGLSLAAGVAWALAIFDIVATSKTVDFGLWLLWMLSMIAGAIMDRRDRAKDWRAPEPSAASSAMWVIVATGSVAVVTTYRAADSSTALLVPVAIAAVSMLLAFAAFRFASKNADKIGEARFKTSPARDANRS